MSMIKTELQEFRSMAKANFEQIDFILEENVEFNYNAEDKLYYAQVGDVVQITDTAGNVVNQYDYDVWGNFLTKNETIKNHFTYFRQTYDETTGLYYLRARYYDPSKGRFTQQDPIEDGYNWYVYCSNNSMTFNKIKEIKNIHFVAKTSLQTFVSIVAQGFEHGSFLSFFRPLESKKHDIIEA